ncbi:MAG: hypothetical protein ACM3SS_19595 [Rhodospirillaceae bacterium]
MKIWFDTEFIDDGKTIELLSIGMVREDGKTYYAEPKEADRSRASAWVTEDVLPKLNPGSVRTRSQIAEEIRRFAGSRPQFWAYFGAYDWVALSQLYGTMFDVPRGWPMSAMDVEQLRLEKGGETPSGADHADAPRPKRCSLDPRKLALPDEPIAPVRIPRLSHGIPKGTSPPPRHRARKGGGGQKRPDFQTDARLSVPGDRAAIGRLATLMNHWLQDSCRTYLAKTGTCTRFLVDFFSI